MEETTDFIMAETVTEDIEHLTFSESLDSMSPSKAPMYANTWGCNIYIFFFRILLHSTLLLFGSTGNILTMAMLWKERHRTATYFLLFCLSLSDLLVILCFSPFTIPVGVLSFIGREADSNRLLLILLGHLSPLSTVLQTNSIWLTVIVTWHRYVNVCMPYKAKAYGTTKMAKVQSLVLVITSVIIHFPRWFEQFLVYDIPRPGITMLANNDFANNKHYQIIYQITLYYVFLFIVPFLVLIFMTVSLVRALHHAKKRRQEMTSQQGRTTQDDFTLTLIVVVIAFLLCQSLLPVRRILIVIYPERSARLCGGPLFYLEGLVMTAILTNSSVNFVIYVLIAKRFRKKFQHMFKRNKIGPGERSYAMSISNDMDNPSRREQGIVN